MQPIISFIQSLMTLGLIMSCTNEGKREIPAQPLLIALETTTAKPAILITAGTPSTRNH